MNARIPIRYELVCLVGFSLLWLIMSVVLLVGIQLTPYETTDSAGRTMGFNDRFFPEHYLIILRNFRLTGFFKIEYIYEWFLLAMHLAALRFLFRPDRFRKATKLCFFFGQGILFPIGWLGMAMLPANLMAIACCKMDREGFVDVPFIWITAQPVWIVAALIIAIVLLKTRPPQQS